MCKYCKDLNEEKERITIEELHLHPSGYYNYSIPLIHCPNCGKILNKYKYLTQKQINNGIY